MNERQRLGEFGERVAAHRLEAGGMRVVARNVRTPGGEIDIVAHDGGDVVFVEVRTRRAAPGLAAETVGPVKLRRMWQCAMDYCEAGGIDPERVRIDVVSVDLGPGGQTAHVEHFRGVEIPDE
ncbi:MAG: YraN family protein [Dehalococcoidia bacterium]|nr:MAG: YraN family protein [bacterium]MCE7929242.1 YraN family protein [Chloroflexi bacterium CFX7]MCK6565049.1 YraN family protein [Dehalococcoidia bacterium]NUQ56263.1 YraN family protein [Dehalococcoidia bacterium]RIL01883.1 MAG: YraN family protein [bacterium]